MSDDDDFGHSYASGPGFYIDVWGAGPFVIRDGPRSWRFEFSARFGPLLLRKDDTPERQPTSERDPFWRPFNAWLAQGKRTEADGSSCIWDEPKPTIVTPVRIKGKRGKQFLLVEEGDEGGEVIVQTPPPTGSAS